MPATPAPSTCPVCGEEGISPNAKACPACGADDRSGWRVGAAGDDDLTALGLPGDEDFDYEAFVAEEFGTGDATRRPRQGWLWWAVGIALLAALVAVWVLPYLW